jgi:hypothetical protein
MSVEVRIGFEHECYKCYGNGYLLSSSGEEKKPCERCRGVGRAPTELGDELLEFLEHQGFKPVLLIESGKGR